MSELSIPSDIREYANYIISLIQSSNEDHPLKVAYRDSSLYFCDFLDFMIHIHKEFSDKCCDDILINKLQLSKKDFDEDKYYQSSTEISVIFFLFCIKHSRFDYEKVQRQGTDKQPECAVISTTGNKFIVEAKCPTQESNKNVPNKNTTLIFRNIGRANSLQEHKEFLEKMKNDFAIQDIALEQGKNTDNKMLDFLQSASLKFSDENKNHELNILFIALDSVYQIQEWVNYFYFNEGFFTQNSFASIPPYCYLDRKNKETYVDPSFKNIHIIVFTNNFFRHKNNTNINGSAWRLSDGFNFAIENPHANLKSKKAAIQEFFSNYLGIYTKDIQNYTLPFDTPECAVNALKIIDYVNKELEDKQGIYYWEKPKEE